MATMCPGTEFETRVQTTLERKLYRCTTCGRVNRTTRNHQEAGRTTASHDKTMAILWDSAIPIEDAVLTFEIIFPLHGGPRTRCPHCGELDSINEADSCIRWNRLELSGDGASAIAHTGNLGDFEGDGWICTHCLSRNLVEPDGFDITDWV